MTRQKAFTKGISIVIAVVFLWSNCVWADELLANKLAARSSANQTGQTICRNPEVGGLFLGTTLMERLGINDLSGIVEHFPELENAGVICFVRPDMKDPDKTARYVFCGNRMFRKITKAGESVETDFDKLLETTGKEETVGVTTSIWCLVPQGRLSLVNSFLENISAGRWSINPVQAGQLGGNDGTVKTFAPHGLPLDYSQISDGFIEGYDVILQLQELRCQVPEEADIKAQQLAVLVNNALQMLNNTLNRLPPEYNIHRYWTELLARNCNRSSPIKIRVNSKISENSVRYYNSTTGEVEIIFNQIFIVELLRNMTNMTAVSNWLLAERLFHELGHDNKIGSVEEEREEEAELILEDHDLFYYLRTGKVEGISVHDVKSYFTSARPKFRSGYYFRFLDEIVKEIKTLRGNKRFEKLAGYFKKDTLMTIANLWLWQIAYRELLGLDIKLNDLVQEEYLQLADERGKLTGRIKPRQLIQKEGDWHRDVRILILSSDGKQLLVKKRQDTRDREPGRYTESVNGRLQLEENYLAAVLREMGQKVDIDDVGRERLFDLGTFKDDIKGINSWNRSVGNRYVYILTPEQETKLRQGGDYFADLDVVRDDALANADRYTKSLYTALIEEGIYNSIKDASVRLRTLHERADGLLRGQLTDIELSQMSAKELADVLRLIDLLDYDMEGKFLLYSAAPGSGKGDVMDITFVGAGAPYSDLVQKLTLYHTRRPREDKGEVEGVHYHFGSEFVGQDNNRLLILSRDGKIYVAYVNKQLQGLAKGDFREVVKVHKDVGTEKILSGDNVIGQGSDGRGDFTLVERPIKGLSSAFGDSKITILEGGYGWYRTIKGEKKRAYTIFISPFTDSQIELRTANKIRINEMFSNPEDRLKAYWILNRIRKESGREEVILSSDLEDRIRGEVSGTPLENFRLREGTDNARHNANIIESNHFIDDLNRLLSVYFKSAYRIDTPQKEALARELAYEVHMKLIKDKGRGKGVYRLEMPGTDKEMTANFSEYEDAYNRVLEGVVQIMLMHEYEEDNTGAIVLNQFVWSGDIDEIEDMVESVSEDFCKKYFIYLLKAINEQSQLIGLNIHDMLEVRNEASKVLYAYLLYYAKGEREEIDYLKRLFNNYANRPSGNKRASALWLNGIIQWIESEVERIKGIPDFSRRKEEFQRFYNSTDFGGDKGASWGRALLLRLFLPSVLSAQSQNFKNLILEVIGKLDEGVEISKTELTAICNRYGINDGAGEWCIFWNEVVPLLPSQMDKSIPSASSLSKKIDGNKKETILYSVKIDIEGNVLRDTANVREAAKADSRFEEGAIQQKLQMLINYLKATFGEGIIGPIKEFVIVDNLGGIDSEIPEIQLGSAAYLRRDQMLIDIDIFKHEMALKNVGAEESFEATLNLVEDNPGIREVTAKYCALKELLRLAKTSPEELGLYIDFLKQKNNGLDSSDYALLLEYIRDSKDVLDEDGLIALAIGYVLNTPRYKHLGKYLGGVLSSDIREAEQKMGLAKGIYTDIVRAKTGSIKQLKEDVKPIIDKVKIARVLMKIRMLVSSMAVREIGLVESLLNANSGKGKYVRLYVEDFNERPYIVEWLKDLLKGKEKSPFLICSREEDKAKAQTAVDEFLRSNNIKQAEVPKDVGYKDVIDAQDLGFVWGRPLPKDCLSLPFIYSVSGIYLAARVVLVDGDINQLREQDPLAYNTLMAMYTSVFGPEFTVDTLRSIIFGTWPELTLITEAIEALCISIVETEKAA